MHLSSAFLALGVCALACHPAAADDAKDSKPRAEAVAFEKEIEPILAKRCTTCHSGSVKKGRLDLANYEGLIKGGKRGTAILPGKAENSLLYKLIAKTSKPYMPPKGEEPPTAGEIALVKLWLDQGAKAPTTARGKTVITLHTPPPSVHPVRAVAISPDKTVIAVGSSNQINLYDGLSGVYVQSLTNPDLKGPDGKNIKAAHIAIVDSLAYSPDGKWLISGSFQEIAIWEMPLGRLKERITGFAHAVVATGFSPDGKLLAACGGEPTADGEIKVFESASWHQLMDLKGGHSDTVYGAAFSPDGKMLATASADKFIKIWEVPSGKFVKSFEGHTHHVLDVGWMADGKLLASAGGDNTVKIWDFDKDEQARTINAHAKQVTRLVFVGKKSEILTAGGDSLVKKFNAANGGNIGNYGGASDFIYAVAVSGDGLVIAAGGEEGIVRVYSGANAQLLRTLEPPRQDRPRP